MTDAKLEKLMASLAVSQAELVEQHKKTEATVKEVAAQHKKTEAEIGRALKEVTEQQKKTDAKLERALKKVTEQQKKTDVKLAQVSEMVGSMANTRGEIAEEFFYRSLCENPCLGSLRFHHVYRHLGGSVDNIHDEYNVVLLNDNMLVIVEVKAKAKRNTFQQLVKRKIPNFALLFPEYKKYEVYGAVASLVSSDKMIGYAEKHGVFFITQKSHHLSLMNKKVTVF